MLNERFRSCVLSVVNMNKTSDTGVTKKFVLCNAIKSRQCLFLGSAEMLPSWYVRFYARCQNLHGMFFESVCFSGYPARVCVLQIYVMTG